MSEYYNDDMNMSGGFYPASGDTEPASSDIEQTTADTQQTADTYSPQEEQEIPSGTVYYAAGPFASAPEEKAEEVSGGNDSMPAGKKKKKKKGVFRRVAAGVLAAALIGTAAAGAFIGVIHVSGYGNLMRQAIDAANAKTPISQVQTNSSGVSTSYDSKTEGATVSDIAEKAMPSIVAITSTVIYQNYGFGFFSSGGQEVESGSGSGIIIGENENELLIVTNNHVVADASALKVAFIDNTVVDATIKGTDEDNDLAVVAVPLSSLTDETKAAISIAALGDSDSLKMGQQVVAIGNALGLGQTVTAGYVSALDRQVTVDGNTMTLLQTDAAINPGNSGGALLNMNGEVVGINSAKYTSTEVEGIGYAIPISLAKDIINELMNMETLTKVDEDKMGYLGIQGQDVDSYNAQIYGMPEGVYIYSIVENAPAASSGLRAKDIITKLDGRRVKTKEELSELLQCYSGGTEVTLTVQRQIDGEYQEQEVKVTLGYKKDFAS